MAAKPFEPGDERAFAAALREIGLSSNDVDALVAALDADGACGKPAEGELAASWWRAYVETANDLGTIPQIRLLINTYVDRKTDRRHRFPD